MAFLILFSKSVKLTHMQVWKWLKPTWATFHLVPFVHFRWNTESILPPVVSMPRVEKKDKTKAKGQGKEEEE
jgi:hypothetical protein